MSDARTRALERRAALGDPEARAALMTQLARAEDPDLRGAADLRHELRGALFRILGRTARSSYLRFAPVVAVLAEGLQSEASPGVAFRSLGSGPWLEEGRPGAAGVLVACRGEEVWVGFGGAEGMRKATPGSLWHDLRGLPSNARAATKAERVEAWMNGDLRTSYPCWDAVIVRTTRQVARALCRFEAYAGPRGHLLWQRLNPTPLRPFPLAREERPPTKKDAQRIAKLSATYDPDEWGAILLEQVGHTEPERLNKFEASHLAGLLESWSGEATIRERDRVRLEGYLERLDLDEVALSALLTEVAGVEHPELLAQEQVEAVLARLAKLEGKAPPAEPRGEAEEETEDLGPWTGAAIDDAAFEALLPRRDDPAARRAIGAQWAARTAARAFYLDVPALTAPPVERWRAKLPGRAHLDQVLYASPLGVLVRTKKHAYLLDADTGELRAEFPKTIRAFVAGEVVLAAFSRNELAAIDAWTGKELYRVKVKGGNLDRAALFAEWLLAGVKLRSHRIDDPRRPPEPDRTWRDGPTTVVSLTRDGELGLSALDYHGELVDDRALVALAGTELVFWESGERRWGARTKYRNTQFLTLAPDTVWASTMHGTFAWDRATGERIGEHTEPAEQGDAWQCRELLLRGIRWSGHLVALDRTCAERWRVQLTTKTGYPPAYPAIRPGWKRIYAIVGQREVVCLEG